MHTERTEDGEGTEDCSGETQSRGGAERDHEQQRGAVRVFYVQLSVPSPPAVISV